MPDSKIIWPKPEDYIVEGETLYYMMEKYRAACKLAVQDYLEKAADEFRMILNYKVAEALSTEREQNFAILEAAIKVVNKPHFLPRVPTKEEEVRFEGIQIALRLLKTRDSAENFDRPEMV